MQWIMRNNVLKFSVEVADNEPYAEKVERKILQQLHKGLLANKP